MTTDPQASPAPPEVVRLAQSLQGLRLERGWNMDHVATQAGISRTTLFHLENAEIRRPRASTLHKLAGAFNVPVAQLLQVQGSHGVSPSVEPTSAPCAAVKDEPRSSGKTSFMPRSSEPAFDENKRREFDRATNPIVQEVASIDPGLFAGWTEDEWDELYSQFATGGALREEGVRITAARINHDRETLYRLRVLLQTHLAEVAAGMVNTLYDLVSVDADAEQRK